ncbi:hypothetical protein ACQJBY_035279 [Aegilops geniculata]
MAAAGSEAERSGEKPPANAPALEAAKAVSPERGIQSPVNGGPGEEPSGESKVVEERREDALRAADAERKVFEADEGAFVDSTKAENIKKLQSEARADDPDAEPADVKSNGKNVDATTGAAKEDGSPVEEEDPTKVPEAEDTSSTNPAGTSRSWSSTVFKAGKAIEESSRYVGSWHAPLQHSSDFLRQVARYAPATGLQQGCPAAFIWLSWACDKVSAFLAEAATTVQGASALGRMVGRCTSMIGNNLKAEPGEEPEPDKKDGTAKVLITSCDQLEEALRFWEAGARIQLDIGPDVSAALANLLYDMLKQRGPAALDLIKNGSNMAAKRSGA